MLAVNRVEAFRPRSLQAAIRSKCKSIKGLLTNYLAIAILDQSLESAQNNQISQSSQLFKAVSNFGAEASIVASKRQWPESTKRLPT
jgi:hypothetical protein